jgi:hypothetical protein
MKHFQSNGFQSSITVVENLKSSISRSKLGKVVFSLFFCLSLSSCNKDGFYEKEYLSDPLATETTAGADDGGQDGGVVGGVDGGTQGGVDSGVDGGTNGSATSGSATGGSTDGSTAGGSSTTTGGTDGSDTTGGATTTTGGTDGSSTTGGTSGGSVTGGTDGSTAGGSTTGTSYESATENFQQSAEQTKKIDILWIVDNSGSMANEQESLGRNFDAFISDFITKNVDFKMAITTTDTSSDSKNGKIVTGSDTKLTSAMAQADEDQFMLDFKNLVKVGISGSGYEKGLQASEGFMAKHAASWMRSDAYLAVVIISDEEDQSPKTPQEYWDNLVSFKSSAGLAKVYTIVDKTLSNSGSGISTGYQRYASVANASAGIVSDIREDFAGVLGDMGTAIINLLDSFALAATPVDGSLKVFVNDVETTQYSYDAASRSIKFDQGQIPPVNATIRVTYLK